MCSFVGIRQGLSTDRISIRQGYLLLLEICQGVYDDYLWFFLRNNLGLFVIKTAEYPFRLDDGVHPPLEIQVLVTSDGFVVLDSDSVQLNQTHEHFGGDFFVELELNFAVE